MTTTSTNPYRVLDKQQTKNGADGCSLPGFKPPLWKHIFAFNGKLIDNTVLNVMEYFFNWGSNPNGEKDVPFQLRHALETYTDSDLLNESNPFFVSGEAPERVRINQLSRLSNGRRSVVTFESDYEPFDDDFAEQFHSYLGNETCRIHYWEHDTGNHPTIVILHSWCGGWLWMEEKFLKARQFFNQGFDLAFVTLPFHGKRTPEQALFSGQLFPSTDIKLTMEGFGQAVHDVHSVLEWLRTEENKDTVGMLGLSLGGFISSLMVGLESDLDFAVPIIAPASFADILWFHGEDRPLRKAAREENLDLDDLRKLMELFCPLHYQRDIDNEKLFIVAGLGDRIVPPSHSVSLWRHWDRPRISWFPGSHMLHIGRSDYLGEIMEWLKKRVDLPASA
jgi:pimeloyl-ACP methyl ester carboxylesterase